MAGDEGATNPVSMDQMDSMDQAAMAEASTQQAMDSVTGIFGGPTAAAQQAQDAQAVGAIQDRANKKAELAQAASAGTSMRVDPAEVDGLASFFEDEAQGLEDRDFAVSELAAVQPPGKDPASVGAADVYSQVGAGGGQGYYENYMHLAKVFRDTANSLRASAKQTRTDDQNAADSFKGDVRA